MTGKFRKNWLQHISVCASLLTAVAAALSGCNPTAAPQGTRTSLRTEANGQTDSSPTTKPKPAAPSVAPIVSCPQSGTALRPTWTWVSGGGGGTGKYRYKVDDQSFVRGAVLTSTLLYTPTADLSLTTHTLYVEEEDKDENWSAPGTCTTSIVLPVQAPGPVVPSAAPAQLPPLIPQVTGKIVTGVPVWTWTSGGRGGVGNYRYKLDSSDFSAGATPTTLTNFSPFSTLINGNHTLYVEEANAAGTWSDYGSFVLTIVNTAAASAPIVMGPLGNSDGRPTWSWQTGGGGSGSYRYKLDSTDFTTGAKTTAVLTYQPLTPLTSGTHTLYVEEQNAGGVWSGAGLWPVLIDTTVPGTPTITGLALTNSPTPTLNWTSGGNGGSGYYQYEIDTSDFTSGAVLVHATTLITSILASGAHTFYLQERNAAGTWSATASFSFTIKTTPPNPPVLTAVAYTKNTKPTWTWITGGGGNGMFRASIDSSALSSVTPSTVASYTPTTDLPTGHSYTLYVQEADDAGNWSQTGSKSIDIDNFSPTTGNSGQLATPTITDHSVTLTWTKATDPGGSNPADLVYQAYFSNASNLLDVASTINNGTPFGSPTTDINTVTVTGLTPFTTYYFIVLVQDQAGNKSVYHQFPGQTYHDFNAPTPGASGALTITNVSSDQMTVNWTAAGDDVSTSAQLSYVVVYSTTNNVATAQSIFAGGNGTIVTVPQNNITSQTITGLSAGATYYINVAVWDSATTPNPAAYVSATQQTLSFAGGSGTLASPYVVTNLAELQNVGSNLSAYYQLGNDIDASASYTWNNGDGFTPIGNNITPFTGTFDGNGKTINHLFIDKPLFSYMGLFGEISNTAVLKNFAVTNAFVQGANYVGGVVGLAASGSIQMVAYQGAVQGSTLGLLAGYNNAAISDSWAEGSVVGGNSTSGAVVGGDNIGGITGINGPTGSLLRSYAVANVYSNFVTASAVGGLVGTNAGSVTSSFGFGMVGGVTGAVTGALVGVNNGTVTGASVFGWTLNPVNCVATDNQSMATDCTVRSNGRAFFQQTAAPLTPFDFTTTWVMPDSGRLPVLSFQNHNAAVSFGPEFRTGRRVSSADKVAYKLWGYCNSPGATISLSFTDSSSVTPAPTVTTCVGGIWQTTTNLTAAAQGDITVSLTQTVAMSPSAPVTLVVNKQTSFCDASPGTTFAGGHGLVGDPYTICTLTQLNHVAANINSGVYFMLMNSIDLSSGFSTIGSLNGGNFDGNNYVLRGAVAALFDGLTTGTVSNLNMEDIAIASNNAYGNGPIGNYVSCNSSPVLTNIFTTGYVSSSKANVGGVIGGSCTPGMPAISATGSSVVVAGLGSVGGIAGYLDGGSVSTASYGGYLFGSSHVGGIVGWGQTFAFTSTTVKAIVIGSNYIGGVGGLANGSIDNSTAAVNVYLNSDMSANTAAGGLAGYGSPTVTHTDVSGFVTGTSMTGGIVGYGGLNANYVGFTGDVVGMSAAAGDGGSVGGVIGMSGGDTVANSTVNANIASQGCSSLLNGGPKGTSTYTGNKVQGNVTSIPGNNGGSYTGGLGGGGYAGTTINADRNSVIATFNGSYGWSGGLFGINLGLITATNNRVIVNFVGTGSTAGLIVFSDTHATSETIENNYAVISSNTGGTALMNNDSALAGTVDHNFAIITNSAAAVGIQGTTPVAATYANNYFLTIPQRLTSGSAGAQSGVTGETLPSYFNTPTNPLFSTWDFTAGGIWKIPTGGGLPILK